MTTSSTTRKSTAPPWQPRSAAGWLALAASPTFALMAWIAASDAAPQAMCGPGLGLLPVDGMAAMYLLMSLFHLPPWLRLRGRPAGA